MRKWLALILTLPVVLGSVGFRLSTHFCCGEPVAMEVGFPSEAGCCGEEEENESRSGGCCSNETVLLATSPGKFSTFLYSLPPPVFFALPPHLPPGLPMAACLEIPAAFRVWHHTAPSPRSRPAWLAYQNLRI